jgi:hypothetical protein
MDNFLDEMADEVARSLSRSIRHSHGPGCGCTNCACGDELDEIETPPNAVGPQLPLWRGWSPAARLADIVTAWETKQVPPGLARFFVRGNQVYRISRAGSAQALSIGMTKGQKTIAQRVYEHAKQRKRGDWRVFDAIQKLPLDQWRVQAAILDPQDMHPRRTRLYEGWLQDRERPMLYQRNSTTFDEIARRAAREDF